MPNDFALLVKARLMAGLAVHQHSTVADSTGYVLNFSLDMNGKEYFARLGNSRLRLDPKAPFPESGWRFAFGIEIYNEFH